MPSTKYPENLTTNLVFIGFSGTGKTTISKNLATLLNAPVYNIDSIIEARYGKIPHLFANYSESHFRDLETKVITDIIQAKAGIIDCGGGVVEREENMGLLRKWGKILWLDCPLDLILTRTAGSNRPLLTGRRYEDLMNFYKERQKLYQQYHMHKVDTTKSLSEITNEILGIITQG